MKPETLGIFGFLVSRIAFQLLGLLVYFAIVTLSSYSPGVSNGTNLLIITETATDQATLEPMA